MTNPPEPRSNADLSIRVFGMDADGHPFSQKTQIRNISNHGVQLVGLEKRLKAGDVIGVQGGEQKARCKVIWVTDTSPIRSEAGIELMQGQPCPWLKEMSTLQAAASTSISRTTPATTEKRKFPRHRIRCQIEIRDGQSVGTHMRTETADISGNGCYIETMQPLPVDRMLNISLWLDSELVQTRAIVRTCDGGVGMGLEFIGLDEETQHRLRRQIELLSTSGEPSGKARGAS